MANPLKKDNVNLDMTLKEFNKLDDSDKLNLILRDGNIVSLSNDGYYKNIVYRMSSFYADVTYDKDLEYLHMIRTFICTVNLSELVFCSN